MIIRAFKRAFWCFYDNLFKSMLLNVILFIMLLTVFFISNKIKINMYLSVCIMLFIWHIISPAYLFYFTKLMKREESHIFRDVFTGLRYFALKGMAIFLINLIVAIVVFEAIEFYKNIKGFGIIVGGIALWGIIMFLFMQLYIIPVMVLDEKRRLFVSYKKSFLMIIGVPFSTIIAAVLIAYLNGLIYFFTSNIKGIALAALLPIFGLPFLNYSFIIFLQLNCAMLVYEKHGIMPSLKEAWEQRDLISIFKPWDQR